MEKVAVVTDSIACLTDEMIAQYGIGLVPANILFDGRAYKDYVDITPSEALQLLERDPDRFTTSAPSPMDYVGLFRQLSTRAESILCITISSKISAFYNIAQVASEQVKEESPRTTIEVMDSQLCAAAEGFVVLAAARAAAAGGSLSEVIQAAEAVREKVNFFALMETIRYVYRTGRIPKVASQVGSVLNIKPIIGISDGALHITAVARTKERGVNRLLQMVRERVGGNPVHVSVMHADALEEAQRLKERVSREFDCTELWISEFSPIMAYSTGRGMVGLAFYSEG